MEPEPQPRIWQTERCSSSSTSNSHIKRRLIAMISKINWLFQCCILHPIKSGILSSSSHCNSDFYWACTNPFAGRSSFPSLARSRCHVVLEAAFSTLFNSVNKVNNSSPLFVFSETTNTLRVNQAVKKRKNKLWSCKKRYAWAFTRPFRWWWWWPWMAWVLTFVGSCNDRTERKNKQTINFTAITMVNSGKDIQSNCHLSEPN